MCVWLTSNCCQRDPRVPIPSATGITNQSLEVYDCPLEIAGKFNGDGDNMFWDSNLHQPAWWTMLVLGAVLASALPTGLLQSLMRYIREYLADDHFVGTWFYYSGGFVDGRPTILRECRLEVRRAFFFSYIAYSYFPANEKKRDLNRG